MIAVMKRKYWGLKSTEPVHLLAGANRVLSKFSFSERAFLRNLLSGKIEFIDNPMYHSRKSVRELEAGFEGEEVVYSASEARLLPIDVIGKDEYRTVSFKPLTTEQENLLFMQYNYARYMIYKLVRKRGKKPLTIRLAREILSWLKRALRIRSQITQANIPLVIAMAKRSKLIGVEFTELISEGNMALLRSIDKFDCSRGFKFSTYSCRAILKSFSRTAMKVNRYRGRFPTEFDPDMERSDQIDRKREDDRAYYVDRLRDMLVKDEVGLSDVEREVLRARFAVKDSDERIKPMTLEETGNIIGVTKERVRQIQNKALKKLRVALEEFVMSG